MPKSRNRKDHKKKVNARNKRINDDKKRMKNAQNEFLKELIKREQEKGSFDDTQSIDSVSGDQIEGPAI